MVDGAPETIHLAESRDPYMRRRPSVRPRTLEGAIPSAYFPEGVTEVVRIGGWLGCYRQLCLVKATGCEYRFRLD